MFMGSLSWTRKEKIESKGFARKSWGGEEKMGAGT